MPQAELLGWFNFFKRRPIGWREDQRTYMLLSAQGVKAKADDLFVSLKQLQENIPAEDKALPSGNFLNKMLSATGGDESGWTPPWMNKND